MIRPEARQTLWRWREVVVAAGLAFIAWYFASGYGLLKWVGWIVGLLALTLGWTGLQRSLFRQRSEGHGHITLSEHELSYLGPELGSIVSLDAISAFHMSQTHWHIEDSEGNRFAIPKGAAGSDALFDACAALPGFPMGQLTKQHDQMITIWRRDPSALRLAH